MEGSGSNPSLEQIEIVKMAQPGIRLVQLKTLIYRMFLKKSGDLKFYPLGTTIIWTKCHDNLYDIDIDILVWTEVVG